MDCFWEGFGKICMSVVVLMICADIFSQGLIRMGFIDFIVLILTILPVSKFVLMFILGIVVFLPYFWLEAEFPCSLLYYP